jgi:hypothetical protein
VSIGDAYLLTEDAGGPLAVPGLGLVVDQIGVTVLKPGGTVGAVIAWTEIVSVDASERSTTPGGTPALVLKVADTLKTHRFVLPSSDPEGLQHAISELAARSGVSGARRDGQRRLRPILVGAVVVVVAAVVAVLLLASSGAIKL